MFDFGAPVGFRIAIRHPERVQGLVLQNGNAYEAGLGPGMQALLPYWSDRAPNESAVRGFLTLDATRSQYVDGVPDPTTVDPDLWELDQRYLELPGRDQVMLDLLYDYQTNVGAIRRGRSTCATTPRRRCSRGDATTPFSRPTGPRLPRRPAGRRVAPARYRPLRDRHPQRGDRRADRRVSRQQRNRFRRGLIIRMLEPCGGARE